MRAKLVELMRQSGFAQVERLDGHFYQPILVGAYMPHCRN